MTSNITTDPYKKLVREYREARKVWADNAELRSAAAALDMSEREYCDRYLAMFYPPQSVWTTDGSLYNAPWRPLEQWARDKAFAEAAPNA